MATDDFQQHWELPRPRGVLRANMACSAASYLLCEAPTVANGHQIRLLVALEKFAISFGPWQAPGSCCLLRPSTVLQLQWTRRWQKRGDLETLCWPLLRRDPFSPRTDGPEETALHGNYILV